MKNNILLTAQDGEETEVFVEERTKLNGVEYLLVSDSPADEAEAYILKDVSDPADPEAIYEVVEDEREFEAVAMIFAEMMEDVDIEA